ncbi:MAG: cellulase N-terminal Ig-like domain-containing protein, partial [Limisphaerales bacterium]
MEPRGAFLACLLLLLVAGFGCADIAQSRELEIRDDQPLHLPQIGATGLRIISPTVLELTLITSKAADSSRLSEWDFVQDNAFHPPPVTEIEVTAANRKIRIKELGFKRRPLYAPLKERDLRIANHLYLQLSEPVQDGITVEVKNPNGRLWKDKKFTAVAHPFRWSPVLHVNQEGYVPAFPKSAMVGYYLGSSGELEISDGTEFHLLEARSEKKVFSGRLQLRRDVGYNPPAYQSVYEANFSEFQRPGEYQLFVPGLGTSYPFFINDGIAASFARAYALGLYHQRCGAA